MKYNFFKIFENGHYAANQVYFYKSNYKKSAHAGHARQNFHFQKLTGTFSSNWILFVKICKYLPFTSKFKEQSLKIKLKFKMFLFLFSKNGQKRFFYSKSIFLSFFSFLASEKIETNYVSVATFKNDNVKSKFSEV